MKIAYAIFLVALSISAASKLEAQAEITPGQRLANEMRQTQLLNYERISGTLRTKGRRGKRTSVALTLQTAVVDGQWQSIFRTVNPQTSTINELTIVRGPDQAPRYFSAEGQNGSLDNGVELSREEVMTPFSASEFWVADLGLEFFYWPSQVILKNAKIKMRKGISCYVLESRSEQSDGIGYSRVRSWISRDHGGLIYAEAYGDDGKRIKTFEVSDVEKIDGEWKLKELRIRNEKARATTELEFNNR